MGCLGLVAKVVADEVTLIGGDEQPGQFVDDEFAEVIEQAADLFAHDEHHVVPGDIGRQLRLADAAGAFEIGEERLDAGEDERAGQVITDDGVKMT